MKKVVVILSICLALLLGVCVFLHLQEQQPEETLPPVSYTVRFQIAENTVSQQILLENQLPQTFDCAIPGVTVLGWEDGQGQSADPFTVPATADCCYTAVIRLSLTEHVPYLFADADGNLRPDDALYHTDLTAALEALAAPEVKAYLPEIPVVSAAFNRDMLSELLTAFYEPEAIAAAFPEGTELTRSVFAQGMNQLLRRSADETFTLSEDPVIPGDITVERADAPALLEASVAHTPAEQGQTWDSIALPSSHEPGFMLLEGQLYYVQDDRYLLRDGYAGTLYFDAEGRYTSGSQELDAIVVGLLKDMMAQNPEADRFALLRVAYDYSHQSFTYRRTIEGNPEVGSHGWETQRALDMFETGKGNCYSFAAVFWALSRGLGYDTRAISGLVLSDEQPHSWCFIEFDGMDYIFDPQWQYDYTRREIYEHDMFYLPSDDIYFWGYQWFE